MCNDQLIEQAKQSLHLIIDEIDLSNVNEKQKEVMIFFDFLINLKHVNEIRSRLEKMKIDQSEDCSNESADMFQNENLLNQPMYRFERTLRGGVVPEIGGYVPEGVVRELKLEHGDYVYARELSSLYSNKKHFKYTFAKAGDRTEEPDRLQFNYAIVSTLAGELVVDTYLDGSEKKSIAVNEVPYTIILNKKDIFHYGLKEGSIIDIAISKKNPSINRVIWVHDIKDDVINDETDSIGQKDEKKNRKLVKVEKNQTKENVEQTLLGKTILVVGNEPKKAYYKKDIEMRGGTFLFADARDNVESFEPKVRKADQVIFLLSVSGHIAMKQIKALCKQYNVPFVETWSRGVTSIVRLAENV